MDLRNVLFRTPSMQYDLVLRCLFYAPAMPVVQVWMPGLWKSKTSATRGAATFLCHFSLRQQIWSRCTGWHRISGSRFRSLFFSIVFHASLLPSRVFVSFHAFRISWKVTRATIATCLKWESSSIFLPRLPFSFIREKRLCINALKFMAEKRCLASDFLLVPMKVSAIQQFSFGKHSLFRPRSLQSDN